jgi:hypothetical protein
MELEKTLVENIISFESVVRNNIPNNNYLTNNIYFK